MTDGPGAFSYKKTQGSKLLQKLQGRELLQNDTPNSLNGSIPCKWSCLTAISTIFV